MELSVDSVVSIRHQILKRPYSACIVFLVGIVNGATAGLLFSVLPVVKLIGLGSPEVAVTVSRQLPVTWFLLVPCSFIVAGYSWGTNHEFEGTGLGLLFLGEASTVVALLGTTLPLLFVHFGSPRLWGYLVVFDGPVGTIGFVFQTLTNPLLAYAAASIAENEDISLPEFP